MSFSGFKKQLNKANQYMSEKIGGAEPTKPTQQFIELERKTDLTNDVIEEIIVKTKEMLHPNPALRAKAAVSSKINNKKEKYAHPEREMGDTMVKFGNQLGKESKLGQSLIEMGVTLKETTEIKYSLEDSVKKKFLEPLNRFQMRDIKDCLHHRKKLEGRRLDYDCKKRKKHKGINVFETDLKIAEDKYEESLKLATVAMQHLIDNEKQQIYRLVSLSESLFEYHTQCANIYKSLTTRLKRRTEPNKAPDLNQIVDKIWTSSVDKTNEVVDQHKGVSGFISLHSQFNKSKSGLSGGGLSTATNFVSNQSKSVSNPQNDWRYSMNFQQKPTPKCRALYDFNAENDNELPLKEGEVIELIDKIDDDWFEGTLNGIIGLFPVAYVEVLVPLSH